MLSANSNLNIHRTSHQRCSMKTASCKSGTRIPGPATLGPGTRDPPQSLKMGLRTPLKFKSGTPGQPSKFESGTLGPPTKFKIGTPSSLFNEFIFFRIFFAFFTYLFLCVFLNKIKKIYQL